MKAFLTFSDKQNLNKTSLVEILKEINSKWNLPNIWVNWEVDSSPVKAAEENVV